ncbi:phosphopantetheine-binding protein [Streptomyces amritsarensis]|uniref:phosphopantetheine-binding protein n=1 Tax=Streptomyces amritsarensis TaxID=681158 RepID=UPI00369AFF59
MTRPPSWSVPELTARIAESAFEVLEVPIGYDTDLAEAGLEPSAAIRLAACVQEEFGVRIPVADIYAGRTPGRIAAGLRRPGAAGGAPGPYLPRGGAEAGRSGDVVSLTYTGTGDLGIDPGRLTTALRAVAARQPALRTLPAGAGDDARRSAVLPDWDRLGVDVVPVPDAGWEALQQARDLAAAGSREGLDTVRGPLLRCVLYTWNGGRLLAVHVHRSALDTWSLGVFERELESAYSAARPSDPEGSGRAASAVLRPVPDAEAPPVVAEWHRRLAALPPIAWPTGAPACGDPAAGGGPGAGGAAGGGTAGGDVAEWAVPVDGVLLGRLRAATRTLGVSLTSLVLTAYARGLAVFTGQAEFRIGLVVSGRVEPWPEPVLGRRVLTLLVPLRAVPGEPLVSLARACDRELLFSADHWWYGGKPEPPLQATLRVEPGEPARALRLGASLLAPVRLPGGAPSTDLTAELLRSDGPGGTRQLLFTSDPARIGVAGLRRLAGAVHAALVELAVEAGAAEV